MSIEAITQHPITDDGLNVAAEELYTTKKGNTIPLVTKLFHLDTSKIVAVNNAENFLNHIFRIGEEEQEGDNIRTSIGGDDLANITVQEFGEIYAKALAIGIVYGYRMAQEKALEDMLGVEEG